MDFGCGSCYGEDPGAVLEYSRGGLVITQRLISDSHFGVSVRRCTNCGQQFIAIFTEFVDWSGGDDAQYFDIVPVTPEEADEAIAAGENVSTSFLSNLGTGRRHLASDYPTGGPHRLNWLTGPLTVEQGY
ncbi:hypothetical protein [Actinocrispum sp. NPDC049592]|uniref:hypothetical protein n=1 Tax=Actinocrispum sp. NPDC049592 TaxID=3154835 RepID=UPI003445D412